MMRSTFIVTSLSIAALVLAAGPGFAVADEDKGTVPQRIERKADQAGEMIKDTAHDTKTEVTDSWITSKLKIALFADSRVEGHEVHVVTNSRVVTLRGKVASAEAKTAAGEIAKGSEHVKGVRNELQVVAPSNRSEVTASDKDITKNVQTRLGHDSGLKAVNVDVNNGVVSLSGEVKSIDASAKASEVARSVAGVRSVKNDLTYASRSSLQ
jgi:hyperosmotically inducible periplasmic protein